MRQARAAGRAGGVRRPWFPPHGTQGHIIELARKCHPHLPTERLAPPAHYAGATAGPRQRPPCGMQAASRQLRPRAVERERRELYLLVPWHHKHTLLITLSQHFIRMRSRHSHIPPMSMLTRNFLVTSYHALTPTRPQHSTPHRLMFTVHVHL